MLIFVMAGCGPKMVPEQILKDSIAAHRNTQNFTITMKVDQLLQTEDMSMKQKIEMRGEIDAKPLRYFFDLHAKNLAGNIDASIYGTSDTLYYLDRKSEDGWMQVDDPELNKKMDSSLMDYQDPAHYLQMILDDRNHLRAKETEQGIRVSLEHPEEATKRKMAQILVDSLGEEEPFIVKDNDLKRMDITVDFGTKLIRSMSMEQIVTIRMKEGNTDTRVQQTIRAEYGNYNRSSIQLPEELRDALEATEPAAS
ncbi:hypothetical protein GE107_09380 [Cohnella sp. CFH 77786]|uniref:DUF6612 family protein n=1 Tax=Cohnella sp. CFH 77786 TaxID=2662265 RepID=UPI001C60A361|nr:DUF6612 family protein [Cohnella sp. CFH 77786]MBW5446269.1 hypothetical protein [Cohnella sp. CFH 77786]